MGPAWQAWLPSFILTFRLKVAIRATLFLKDRSLLVASRPWIRQRHFERIGIATLLVAWC